MRYIIPFCLLFFFLKLNAQITAPLGGLIFQDSLEFRPFHPWITIEDPGNNLWQAGMPLKEAFTSPHSGKIPVMTDTLNPYGVNCNDYFYLTLPQDEYIWGEGILSFYHRYVTDSLTDGGIIEISYYEGSEWINVKDDINHINTHFIGLYEDTLKGGIYGFSGNSGGWQYVELYWHWLALTKKTGSPEWDNPRIRFRFVSDEVETGKDGWMIDDLVFRGYDVVGSAPAQDDEDILVFPNPARDFIILKSKRITVRQCEVEVYDLAGRQVVLPLRQIERIYIHTLSPGAYIYRIRKDEKIVQQGLFIKEQH